ncbi:serine/threonine-protein kinase [Aquipseudomonas ullengensis]|uniref:Serine/threonine protein kinase n=1 Tax=Aquipseudomonas ullengensis TaxID=2759166 RepID=A0A7W4Q966_9GAMM|nr:serine/threonine-protein kinase [Pseudomonas ullengensis]MBB2494477.1 serine/threonine protein kinase [Pseudomonas ullengensis]
MSRFEQGTIIGERYAIDSYINEGGMQYVYKAHDRLLDRYVALKTPKNSSATKRFKQSAILSAKVNHHNIAKTLDYVRDGEDRYLIEELIDGTDLQQALLSRAQFIDPHLAARIFNYLAKGLAAAHHANVVHRDLKPTNIMVTGKHSLTSIKITDFGIATMAKDELVEAIEGGDSTLSMSQTAVGALPYMAPEAIESPRTVSAAADIWSIGAMFYQLITGALPFGNGLKAVQRIMNVDITPPPAFVLSNPQFRPLAESLLSISLSCLKKNPKDRPTADSLVSACSRLCYATAQRHEGQINNFLHKAWGFISQEENNVFFHKESVYGPNPIKIGAHVNFSKYDGGGSFRAHPVLIYDDQPE